MFSCRERIEILLSKAGVSLNGNSPWDIKVHNSDLFRRLLVYGSLGLGESYLDSWWDCDRIDELICRLLNGRIDREVRSWTAAVTAAAARILNRQSPKRSLRVGEQHYDIGNDLYRLMLDSRMIYSCACWADADTLDAAQENKLDMICRKLRLSPGQRLLDIGCGWGGLAQFAAERYGVNVVGITISRQQASAAAEMCRGLPVEIRFQDYRSLKESFHRIVSVGMFEHVGYKNYSTYMSVVHRCLKDDGVFLLQTIGGNRSVRTTDPWIERYIFPNGMLPSAIQITNAIQGLFVIHDWHNFGPDYDRTLMEWWRRFENGWAGLSSRYGERFHRMWRYYLLSCAGAFRAGANQLWQIVLTKEGVSSLTER